MSLAIHMTTGAWLCVVGLVLVGLYVRRQIRDRQVESREAEPFDYRLHLNFNEERGRRHG